MNKRVSALFLAIAFALTACGGGGGGDGGTGTTGGNTGGSTGGSTGGTTGGSTGGSTGGTTGGSAGGSTATPAVTLGANKGQILLGPIVGATVFVYSIDDRLSGIDSAPLCSATTSDLASGEPGVVDLSGCNVTDNGLYFVWARGGTDIDADDDGVLDAVPTPKHGDVRAVLTGEQIRRGNWRANILTELGYQAIEPLMLSRKRRAILMGTLDNISNRLLRGDLNNDGLVDHEDLSAFVPISHGDRLQSKNSEFLDSMLEAVLSGDRNRVSYFARSYLLSAIGEFNFSSLGEVFYAGSIIVDNHLAYSYSQTTSDNFQTRDPDIVLGIFDVEDLSNIEPVGFLTIEDIIDYDVPGSGIRLHLEGDLLFVTSSNYGIAIVDVSDPSAPVLLSKYPVNFVISGIHLSGSIAYLYEWDNFGTLGILDISDPSNPTQLNRLDDFDILGISAYDENTLLIPGSTGMGIYDNTDPALPVFIDRIEGSSIYHDYVLSDGYIYSQEEISQIGESAQFGIKVYDASNLDNIHPVSWIPTGSYISDFRLSDGFAYVKSQDIVSTYSLEDPTAPYVVDVRSASGFELAIDDGRLYLSDGYNLLVYPIEALNEYSEPFAILQTAGQATQLTLLGTVAFVTEGTDLIALDVSNPAQGLEELGRVEVGYAADFEIVEDHAYIASEGLVIVDISDPTNMTRVFSDLLGIPELPEDRSWSTSGLAINGNYAYLSTFDTYNDPELEIFDISNLNSPELVAEVRSSCRSRIEIHRNTLFCGLRSYSLSSPLSPSLIDDLNTEDPRTYKIKFAGDTLFVTRGDSAGLQIYNASNPSSLVPQGSALGLGFGNEVAVKGNIAYVANEFGFVDIYDVSNKLDPIFVSQIRLSGAVRSVAANDNYIFATNLFGLVVEPVVTPLQNLP